MVKKTYGCNVELMLYLASGKSAIFKTKVYGQKISRVFHTTDKKLQKEMEEHPNFGTSFILIGEENIKSEEPVQTTSATENPVNTSPTPPPSITTVSKAIKWLVREKGIDESELQNIEAVKNMCMLHGVSFPNVAELN